VPNAEESRARILAAALNEFASHGFAGARMERIAAEAECNKNLIYHYFKSKGALFATVINRNTDKIREELLYTPDDLPGYAARACQYAIEHPKGMRLVAWFALEQKVSDPPERRARFADLLEQITNAQGQGAITSDFPPEFVLTAILALASAWSASSPFAASFGPTSIVEPSHISALVGRAVERLTCP
jgi:AcrR family transcriptional regulator